MTDEAILQLISHLSTQEEGFRQLVIKYQQRLYSTVRRKVTSHEDADDILQNTFIKIFRHIKGYEGRSELFTWIYRIATNEVINHQKRSSRMKTVTLDDHDVRHADVYVNTEEMTLSLETAVARLPERQQMVFRMRYFDELSYKQMAELLQLTEGALKASFHHAVRKIEEDIKSKANIIDMMEKEEDIHDEMKDIAPGFPAKQSMDPPAGYFETFPDQVLNRWAAEESQPKPKMMIWRRVIAIAAVLTGLCIGGWWFFSKSSTTEVMDITSAEAYQYINDNIDDFEPLIESGDYSINADQLNVPKEAIDEYLIQEMHGSNPEDLF